MSLTRHSRSGTHGRLGHVIAAECLIQKKTNFIFQLLVLVDNDSNDFQDKQMLSAHYINCIEKEEEEEEEEKKNTESEFCLVSVKSFSN